MLSIMKQVLASTGDGHDFHFLTGVRRPCYPRYRLELKAAWSRCGIVPDVVTQI